MTSNSALWKNNISILIDLQSEIWYIKLFYAWSNFIAEFEDLAISVDVNILKFLQQNLYM